MTATRGAMSVRSGAQLLRLAARGAWLAIMLSAGLGCAESKRPPPDAASWQELFDGQSLAGWAPSGFEGEGAVKMRPTFRDGRSAIVIERGTVLSSFTWTRGGALPRSNYEISLEAMRLEGADFFCALTFPVGKSACSFVVGGWGGTVMGLSSIDHSDASTNETTLEREFADGRWYRIRVRVTDDKIEAWLDDELVVDVSIKGRTIGLRPGEIQKSLPLGVATFMTSAAVRDIRLRRW